MASLIISSGDTQVSYYPLGRRTNVIGRSESLLIQILDDEVSRKHLQIRFDLATGTYHAVDMNSRNGVFVNYIRINKETQLSDGDHIQIGDTDMLFTDKDFDDSESALHHYRKVGERSRVTFLGQQR